MKPPPRPLVWFCLVVALLVALWLRPARASSSLIDSRVNQLEFRLRALQTEVSQLRSQLPRGDRGSQRPARVEQPVPALDELTLDEQFDNLATLVIEINQRLAVLEAQAEAVAP